MCRSVFFPKIAVGTKQSEVRKCRALAATQDGRAPSHHVSLAARWCRKPEGLPDPWDPLRNHEMTVGSPVEKVDSTELLLMKPGDL